MRTLIIFMIFLIPSVSYSIESRKNTFDHSHSLLAEVLAKYVVKSERKTYVKYKELKNSPHILRKYLKLVSKVKKEHYQSFTKNEKLAFLINAYNALTLELIIRHYPVSSIKDIGSWFSSPWKKEFFLLLEEKHSLDDVEHKMIRKWFNEPRIHFALVCAARSCPPLKTFPYRALKLEQQLKEASENFLLDSERNRLDHLSKTLYLSSIFKWYGSDFERKYGSVKNYIAKFYGVKANTYSVLYLSYDWSLNDFTKMNSRKE